LLFYIPLARNLHNLESLALTKLFTKKHGVREELATHTRHKIRATTHTQVTIRAHNTTRQVHNSNRALIAITKNQMREIEVLVLRNALRMLGVLLHAPRGPFYSPKAARSR
jgi:lipid II:glycine glycyltransferase (peptidoglycan interpeptide bridge formation enzyme)